MINLKKWFTSILVLGVIGYFGYSYYKIYKFVQPTFATSETPVGFTSRSLIKDGEMLDFIISIGNKAHSHEVGFLTSPFSWNFEESLKDTTFKTESWKLVDPTAEHHLTFKIPEFLRKNEPLTLQITAYYAGTRRVAIPTRVSMFSRALIPTKLKKPTRLLLEDPSGKKTNELWGLFKNGEFPAVHSIPKFIEFGPVVELREIDVRSLAPQGMMNAIVSPVGGSSLVDVRFSMHINSFVFPRDEYVPLVKWDTLVTSDVKQKWIHEAPPSLLEEINKVVESDIEVRIRFKPQSLASAVFQNIIVGSLDSLEKNGFNEYDIDSIKMTMTGAAPWLVCVTIMISVLHLLLELLYVSEDVSYWKEKTSFEGMSTFSIQLNFVCHVAITFYLIDCDESKFVTIFPAMRAILDGWKLWKASRTKNSNNIAKSNLIEPSKEMLKKNDDAAVLAAENGQIITEEELEAFEKMWMTRFLITIVPLISIYCLYELIFIPQKGWISWIIGSFASCAYAGGFIVMTPQLLRNYRLKSVEHMPWAALTYQAISTFIDDLFALLVRMPGMHKFSLFKDDMAFFIFHIQRRMYKKTRIDQEVDAKSATTSQTDIQNKGLSFNTKEKKLQ